MCELFGLCSSRRRNITGPLKEFFSHSERHSHGWGMAISFGAGVALEKEPLCANSSHYLRERLREGIVADNMIAHIRLASVGRLFYCNTHPFLKRDNQGVCWTLAHNGTLFNGTFTDCFIPMQDGQTDSERILLCLVEAVNRRQEELGRRLRPEERFTVIDGLVTVLSFGNKLNLLIGDGEYMYVHTNYAHTLYVCTLPDEGRLFSTQPLRACDGDWQPVPFRRLMVYKEGREVYQGEAKSQEYFDPEVDYEYKNLDYANL